MLRAPLGNQESPDQVSWPVCSPCPSSDMCTGFTTRPPLPSSHIFRGYLIFSFFSVSAFLVKISELVP